MKRVFNVIRQYKIIVITTLLSALIVLSFVLLFAQSKDVKLYAAAGIQIDEMAKNIIQNYRLQPSYWGLSTSEVINKKLYAEGMSIKNNKLIGYFGNNVEIGADENGSPVMPGVKNFVITYNNLTKEQCIGLGANKYNEMFWLNVSKITLKNADIEQDFIWGDEEYGLIPSKHALKKMCNRKDNKLLVYF